MLVGNDNSWEWQGCQCSVVLKRAILTREKVWKKVAGIGVDTPVSNLQRWFSTDSGSAPTSYSG